MTPSGRLLDRELSALEFNARVLAEGMDSSTPLLERLKFLGIASSNLDEFFMVRAAGFEPGDPALRPILSKARDLVKTQYQYFADQLLPEMSAAGLARVLPQACNGTQAQYLYRFFEREVLPVLTPIALSDGRPLPVLANLRLHMAAGLRGKAAEADRKYAVVEIPPPFPRFVFLPAEAGHPFVLFEDVVGFYAKELFPGYEIVEQAFFRLTRAAELGFDEEKDEDFLQVMSEALRQRREGAVVRLETSATGSLRDLLIRTFGVRDEAVYEIPSWFDLKSVSHLSFQTGFDDLKQPAWQPQPVTELERSDDPWTLLKEKSILVQHPYDSFDAVLRFLTAAAEDPEVMAIKMVLYRIHPDSSLLRSLERAAEKGKQVTVLIELKARFDEQNNIEWARRLQRAGVTVLYGVAGLKTHAKACLVVRREPEGIRRYVHLSTGNYNERTAALYSDIGYFTSQEDFANDLSAFFNMITGYSQPAAWRKIEVAPYGLRRKLLRLIRREALRSSAEHPGLILAKMNSLSDPEIIQAFYEASKAGVQIRLNVRGICCLKPGVKNMSETIEVISIVDQFLEHARVYYFANGGEEEIYLSSADCMTRNLDRRVEILFPVEEADNKRKLMDSLKLYFKDNVKAWKLLPDGTYQRMDAAGKRRFRVQQALCERATEQSALLQKTVPKDLKPQRPSKSDLTDNPLPSDIAR